MPNTAGSATAQEYQASLAENSRPGGLAWRAKKVGKRRGKVAKRASRVNWFHKLIWPHIHQAAKKFQFSAVQTVRFLQQKDPEMFKTLAKGTVQKWLKKSEGGKGYETCWSDKTLGNVEIGTSVKGSGRVGLLKDHPKLVSKMKEKLEELQDSSISVNRILAQSIMLTLIKANAPELLCKLKCGNVGVFFDCLYASEANDRDCTDLCVAVSCQRARVVSAERNPCCTAHPGKCAQSL
jgi:hypothetical protein